MVLKCVVALVLIAPTSATGQVVLQNEYLANPDAALLLADTTAQFWIPTIDEVNGAFYTNINRDGARSNDEQHMLTQTQNAYGMVRAFQMTGDTTYLHYAQRALDYMYANEWDAEHGGWLDRNQGKEAFTHHYALIGISSMFEVTRDSSHWEMLMQAYEANEEHLWDAREQYLGYFERADEDWSNANGKAFSATMDAITTHALYLYLMTGEPRFKERLLQLADNAVDHFVASMDDRDFGFTETFDSNWNPPWWGGSFDFTGHFTKTAWCLGRIYQVEDDPRYLAAMQRIMDDVLDQEEAYHDFISQWWEYEEAFTSGVTAYYLTGNEAYLTHADERLEYFFDTHWDPVYHEFYYSENDDHKGSYYKTSYHSLEMAYYLYLYGNLYLHDRPASLYYRFEPSGSEREVSLYPLAIKDDLLEVTSVTLDGEPFTAFDPASRTLSLQPEQGGIFKVTFEATGAGVPIEESANPGPVAFTLSQNYPNPFGASTRIHYRLEEQGHVALEVYNVLGEKVAALVDRNQPAGEYGVTFDGRDLASGVYVYRLMVDGQAQSKNMMVLK
jgi:mannose/cellobiose epimerase-like protein (N-acyl-D-glucosamine 2-epimerase family)